MRDKTDLLAALTELRGFVREYRRPPSFLEIARLFRYKSKNAAFLLVNKLIEKGYLRKDRQGKVVFDVLNGIKLLGTVQAG